MITDEAVWGKRHVDIAAAALRGGARVIQLRDKTKHDAELLPIARDILALCRQHGAVFIVDDRADLAVACDADGVHVGEYDLPLSAARKVVGPDRLVGVSCYGNVEAAAQAEREGADYVAVGSIYPTRTKQAAVTGLEIIRQVKARVSLPVVAIGGIEAGNLAEVVRAGADSASVVEAVAGADDMVAATRNLIDIIESAR
ncbi:MAG: thiamine phosphate synthase [Chloroflexi bacterium]|nr:thiamine phosphate synthase [Chloroflexota bacterium]